MIGSLHMIVDDGVTEEDWLAARAEGVTASEIHAIASGGRATWQRILDDKLNGSTFKGNRHTRRGHEREAFLIHHANERFGAVRANGALYGCHVNPLHRATPDALGWNHEMGGFGVEVKSHDHGWTREKIPTEHYDQMQWGMHVTGFDRWLYIYEVMGKDGEPTLDDPTALWVQRNDGRIAKLIAEADAFIAWREAGAPAVDDIPDDLDDAIAIIVAEDAVTRESKARRSPAEATIRQHIAGRSEAGSSEGLKVAGTRGHFTYAVRFDEVLDEEAWQAAEPDTHEEWVKAQAAVDEQAKNAAALYSKTRVSTRLNIYTNREPRQ